MQDHRTSCLIACLALAALAYNVFTEMGSPGPALYGPSSNKDIKIVAFSDPHGSYHELNIPKVWTCTSRSMILYSVCNHYTQHRQWFANKSCIRNCIAMHRVYWVFRQTLQFVLSTPNTDNSLQTRVVYAIASYAQSALSIQTNIYWESTAHCAQGDILLFSGDVELSSVKDATNFAAWLGKLPHPHKAMTFGKDLFLSLTHTHTQTHTHAFGSGCRQVDE